MLEREDFIYNLLEAIDDMIRVIEDREHEDDNFGAALEIAEQLRTEIETLQDN